MHCEGRRKEVILIVFSSSVSTTKSDKQGKGSLQFKRLMGVSGRSRLLLSMESVFSVARRGFRSVVVPSTSSLNHGVEGKELNIYKMFYYVGVFLS